MEESKPILRGCISSNLKSIYAVIREYTASSTLKILSKKEDKEVYIKGKNILYIY